MEKLDLPHNQTLYPGQPYSLQGEPDAYIHVATPERLDIIAKAHAEDKVTAPNYQRTYDGFELIRGDYYWLGQDIIDLDNRPDFNPCSSHHAYHFCCWTALDETHPIIDGYVTSPDSPGSRGVPERLYVNKIYAVFAKVRNHKLENLIMTHPRNMLAQPQRMCQRELMSDAVDLFSMMVADGTIENKESLENTIDGLIDDARTMQRFISPYTVAKHDIKLITPTSPAGAYAVQDLRKYRYID